jgi:prefoldin subunit 1
MGMKEWEAATATVKQGLGVDENNPQLQKQLRSIKQLKAAESAAASRAAVTRPAAGTLDSTTSKELTELQQQYVQMNREYNLVKANILKTQREYKSDEITKAELEKLPDDENAKMYRGIGKIYLLSTRDDVMEHLDRNIETEKKREGDLTQKLDYLERRMQSQKSNMEELLRSPSSAE